MADQELERIYTIPLREPKHGKRSRRAPRALTAIRAYLTRHMKSEKVWIDDAVNQKVWARGKFRIPSKIRVRAIKFADGVVEVSLPEEEARGIREELRAKRDEAAAKSILAGEVPAEAAEEEKPPAAPGEKPPAEGPPPAPEPAPEKPEPERKEGGEGKA